MMSLSPVVVAVAAAALPAIFTDASRPVLEYDCVLIGPDQQKINFAFRAIGGQMIIKDGAAAGFSQRKIDVTADPSGVVSKFPDHYHTLADDYDGRFKHGFGWDEGRSFKIGMELSAQDIDRRNKATLTLSDGYSGGGFVAAGLCDVKKTPQQAIIENKAP